MTKRASGRGLVFAALFGSAEKDGFDAEYVGGTNEE
jgi:hypothetical protein